MINLIRAAMMAQALNGSSSAEPAKLPGDPSGAPPAVGAAASAQLDLGRWQELNFRANQLAGPTAALGVGPDTRLTDEMLQLISEGRAGDNPELVKRLEARALHEKK